MGVKRSLRGANSGVRARDSQAEFWLLLTCHSDPMRHSPGRFIADGYCLLNAVDLNFISRRTDKNNSQEPFVQGDTGIMEKGSSRYRISIAAIKTTIRTDVATSLRLLDECDAALSATDARQSLRPADRFQQLKERVLLHARTNSMRSPRLFHVANFRQF
jgi:hypothetical protein